MAELGSGNGTSYPGALDTDNVLEVDSPSASKTKARADVPNDANAAIVAIQTELGTDPAGSLTDVKTYLQTEHEADGTHGAITPTGITLAGSAWPSFSVHKNGTSQDNITGEQKITWDGANAIFDTNSDFDDANDRFTPTVAGKYLLMASLAWKSVTDQDTLEMHIYKNGASINQTRTRPPATGSSHVITSNITVVVDANGSGDYFEVFAENGQRDTSNIDGGITITWYMGSRIA